ncbi:NUDIX hydrolase [Sorangium sp. So ce1128]
MILDTRLSGTCRTSPMVWQEHAMIEARRYILGAGALIRRGDGSILLLKGVRESHLKFPGGKIEPGESPREACIREIAEELGLLFRVSDLSFVKMFVKWTRQPGPLIGLIYKLVAEDVDSRLEQLKLKDDEIEECYWLNKLNIRSFLQNSDVRIDPQELAVLDGEFASCQ